MYFYGYIILVQNERKSSHFLGLLSLWRGKLLNKYLIRDSSFNSDTTSRKPPSCSCFFLGVCILFKSFRSEHKCTFENGGALNIIIH